MTQREKDLEQFRLLHPHIKAHDIDQWWSDGAAYGRKTAVLAILRVCVGEYGEVTDIGVEEICNRILKE